MEKKRYQVFVSSTFSDLKGEREAIFNGLARMDCIPAGMELFPAFDEEQFQYIKSVINDSDYYVVIVAGRYGSQGSDGISFTEKEFDYALSIGIPILSFVHENPDNIPVGKTDTDSSKIKQLEAFIEKIKNGRVIKFWRNSDDLCLKIIQSLTQTIKAKPRPRVGARRHDREC